MSDRRSFSSFLIAFIVFAAAAAVSQALLLRESLVSFHGTELTIGAFYGSYFLWIALGALVCKRVVSRSGPGPVFLWSSAAYGLTLVVGLLIVRSWKVLLGVGPLVFLPLETSLVGVALGTAGPAFLVGFVFPAAASLLSDRRDSVGLAYVLEASGSLAGGLFFSFVLATHLRVSTALAIVGIAGALSFVVLSWSRRRCRFVVGGLLYAVLWLATLFGPGQAFDRRSESIRWNSLQRGYVLKTVEYSPYGHLALGKTERGDQFGLFVDGVQVDSFPDPRRFGEQAAHLLAQAPQARRVLLIGGGQTGLLSALLLSNRIDHVDLVLQDPWELALVRPHLARTDRAALDDLRVTVHLTDPRRAVADLVRKRRAGTIASYGLVVGLTARPTTIAENRLFTVEYLRTVSQLMLSGVYVQFFSRDEVAYVPKEERLALGSIYHSLAAVFANVSVATGRFHYFVASDGLVSVDPTLLARRYRSLGLARYPYPPDAFPGKSIDKERSRSLVASLRRTGTALNRDGLPITALYGLAYLGRIFRSSLTAVLRKLDRTGHKIVWAILLALMAIVFVRPLSDPEPHRDRVRLIAWSVGMVGFVAMALQVVLLASFQSRFGSLYRQMGLLLGASMAGLAIGGLAGRWGFARLRGLRVGLALFGLVGLSFVLGVWSLILPRLLVAGAWWWWMLFALVSSVLTGAAFPGAAAVRDPRSSDPAGTASVLDASDHLGAAVGGALGGLVLAPVLGTVSTCRLLAAASLAAGSMVGFEPVLSKLRSVGPAKRLSFPWRNLSWRLALVVAVTWAGAWAASRPNRRPRRGFVPSPTLARVVERARASGYRIEEKARPFSHVRLIRQGTLQAVVFSTRQTAPDVRGYAGPIELVVTMDVSGRIDDVTLGENQETPSYVSMLPKWLTRFRGLPIGHPILGHGGIDTITGATVSMHAIESILARSRAMAYRHLLGKQDRSAQTTPSGGWFGKPMFWAVLGFILLLGIGYLRQGLVARLVGMGFSFVVLGVWLNVPLTMVDVGLLAFGHLPTAADKAAVALGALLLALLFGQVWCGSICPFGALQEFIWLAVHPSGLWAEARQAQFGPGEHAVEQRARYVKFVFATLVLGSFFLSRRQEFLLFDPMVWTFRLQLTWARGLLLAAVLVTALFYFRPWCRYVCPVGALMALTNKIALLDRWTMRRRVNQCDLGVETAKDLDCIRCNRCMKRR
ncbi:MAG: 4Fe-4S binding protein [Deltaproteobacteria bacterium]|nr:4Fe-4S binding protein [Deltaproteobacteria bacterium]